MRKPLISTLIVLSWLASPEPATAQVAAPHPAGRISFFVNTAQTSGAGDRKSSELITSITYGLSDRQTTGLEYGVDLRQAQPLADAGRPSRVSVYDSYVGVRLFSGGLRLRGGQMWLPDLGGLGSITGGLAEFRKTAATPVGRLRAGGFGGIEPNTYELGYVDSLWKAGGYVGLDGGGGRRHVAGYVRIDHGGLIERSVVTLSNFVPVRSRAFIYQLAEYDLSGPGGEGHGWLAYLFLNARVNVTSRVDVQGLLNRGRSVDARTITEDLIHGRAVAASALDGLLYQSAGGRVTVRVVGSLRVHAGYTRDRNNRDSAETRRVSLGGSVQNIGGTGVDLTVADSRIDRPTGTYHSVYATVGRQVGRTVYLSADYNSAVSIVRYTRLDGLTVEMRPSTTQVGGSATINVSRYVSLFATGTGTTDEETRELRILAGLTLRLR